ncbi:MAG: DUF3466 family protein [Alphaproteobacteria bacterium]|nr:DUF3466 family protein [Alphaproteobacteria bacterium]
MTYKALKEIKIIFVFVAAFVMVVTNAYAVPVYDVTILRAPPGSAFNAQVVGTDINDARQITGYIPAGNSSLDKAFVTPSITNTFDSDSYAATGLFTDLFYSDLTVLGTLGGTNSRGYAINNNGRMVGSSAVSGYTPQHGVVKDEGTNILTDLGTLGGASSVGQGINDSGQVTGYSEIDSSFTRRAFVGDENGLTDIGTLGGSNSSGRGINNNGQVTGVSEINSSIVQHAFVWDSNNGMTDLGTLGGESSYGQSINNSGVVTGNSLVRKYTSTGRAFEVSHAFLWDSVNGMFDLGTLLPQNERSSSRGIDINDNGQAIGYTDSPSGGLTPYLWENGTMYNLLDLVNSNHPFSPINARSVFMGINNYGDIVVGNYLFTRQRLSNIPEPAPLALFGLGLAGFVIARRRRR